MKKTVIFTLCLLAIATQSASNSTKKIDSKIVHAIAGVTGVSPDTAGQCYSEYSLIVENDYVEEPQYKYHDFIQLFKHGHSHCVATTSGGIQAELLALATELLHIPYKYTALNDLIKYAITKGDQGDMSCSDYVKAVIAACPNTTRSYINIINKTQPRMPPSKQAH